MKINGIELEDLDIFDAKISEKYENVLNRIDKSEKGLEGLKPSEVIRYQCEMIFNVFNELFGEGTDKKIFGDEVNLRVCLSAFAELVEQLNSQKSEIDKLAAKYSPNRVQRRKK